ncbi:MAG: amidohydrolase [Alphaproteobacteria bacterium]|nr:amidohydrolase [Alphaproteobacteria bacterium]
MATALHADTILTGGRIVTMDDKGTVAGALAIWRDRIVALGDAAAVADLKGARTKVIDLTGRTVIPGIVDSHCHPDSHAAHKVKWHDIGYPSVRSIPDMLAMVDRATRALPEGQWFMGFGYNDQKCGGYPTRDQLDAVCHGHPVWLYRTDGHIAIVNSAALAFAGVTEQTPDPPHGRYDRDPATGRMTGLLREMAAWDIDREMNKRTTTAEEYMRGFPAVFDDYLRHGVTSLHNSLTQGRAIDAYQRLRAEGRLPMRIGIILDGRDEVLVESYLGAGVRTGFGDEWIRVVGVEWCPDCSTSGRTAAYYEPYVGTPVPGEPQPNYGMLLYEKDELAPRVARAHAAGLRVCVEGLGDRGIDFALDVIEAALQAHPRADHRSRIEHCCYVTPPILERIKKLGCVDSSATGFMWSLGDAYAVNRGSQAMHWMFPHRALIDASVPAPGHSDAPVCGTNPWPIIQAMVTRKTDTGQDFGPGQAITVTEALAAYTVLGAWAGFEEALKGSLEVGKLADLAVLDQDPFTCDPETIKDTTVALTMVGGAIQWSAP